MYGIFENISIFALTKNAQMAELVDALVSNTSGFTSMPVRSRLWVLKRRKLKNSLRFLFLPITTYLISQLTVKINLFSNKSYLLIVSHFQTFHDRNCL